MTALLRPIGRINPAIHGSVAGDPWQLAAHLAELERRVGQALTTEVLPFDEDLSVILIAKAKLVFDLCQIASGRQTGKVALAQRVRHHALEIAIAPGEPISLSLLAFCAYIALSERTALPPHRHSEKILDWYLSSFLVDQPAEIAPADFAALRDAARRSSALAPALGELTTVAPPAPPIRRSTHRTGNVLYSGQHVLFANDEAASRYLLAGDWYHQEPDHTWSKPWSAMLAFDVEQPIGAQCLIEVALMLPHLPADMKEQCLITLNSVPIKRLTRHGRLTVRLLVPGTAFQDGANYVGFHAPDFSPSRHGSPDQRNLGVAVSRFRILLDV